VVEVLEVAVVVIGEVVVEVEEVVVLVGEAVVLVGEVVVKVDEVGVVVGDVVAEVEEAVVLVGEVVVEVVLVLDTELEAELGVTDPEDAIGGVLTETDGVDVGFDGTFASVSQICVCQGDV